MYKTDSSLIEKCRTLRKKGFTLGDIIKATKLPKTTIFDHIQDIPLSVERKREIQEDSIKRITEFSRKRKGKCLFGRVVPKPEGWTKKLIFLTAHFMFDGEISKGSCIYNNRNKSLIDHVKSLMGKVFNLQPYDWFNKDTGVRRISYHYVELADYIREKARELKIYIKIAALSEKKIFLKAFFDDEGSVHFDKKLVRGYQHNLEILKLIQDLLKDFDIESKIDEKYKEIVISRKPNLIKFRDRINFSKGIYINPARKNSIWKKKLEKRKILDYLINSYQK
ncbi:MAG: hypothetical protein COS25_02000 [Candidatus Nealsonbacteria bacterium CG02_land_8_20_14_3_00_37_10]|uniref:Homing endonuclease LAGLIDADG domain-containing protein n=2 Tax=Candidatus Nealsoniibacteriota TaxID=1817911 RepID=A0A2G9YYC5_9BACT|nr:MAG: hypothetical protein COX35_01895 [Candidatus Nealsonbacteria bacterium CG23_combo_of_CG06-09_8_20_14_all_37_18]PIV45030.1 MAG: hypothetical protein COS25_02000 [Candidatus Nealsonbacteria bacterium CG02_land_8_20_14_3_00_37_10]